MHEKDWLDHALHEAEEPLPDAGFTLRVTQTLPPMVEPFPIVIRPRMVAPA